MTATVQDDRLRQAVALLTPGTGVDCVFTDPNIPDGTYTVRGEAFIDQRGPEDVLCVGNDSIAYCIDGTWTPDTYLREIRLADDVDDKRWNATINSVAEALEAVPTLDADGGFTTAVEVDRVRDALSELYRGERG